MMSFVCALPVIASLIAACAPPAPLAVGYVEGEFVLLAPLDVAQVTGVDVQRGQHVEAGEVVAEMERDDARIAVDNASAALLKAQAQLADLRRGRRPEEIAVIAAQLTSAEAEAGPGKAFL